MASINESVEVNVPVRTAYDQWTQFESFPQFMDGVQEVKQLDDKRLHWVADVAGKREEWDAEITQQEPDMRVAWKSTSGASNGGVFTFHRIKEGVTRVTLQMDWEPDGVIETVGDKLGLADRKVKGDLDRFKDFMESGDGATGAWRGKIEQTATK